jgi:hypothetical protein
LYTQSVKSRPAPGKREKVLVGDETKNKKLLLKLSLP